MAVYSSKNVRFWLFNRGDFSISSLTPPRSLGFGLKVKTNIFTMIILKYTIHPWIQPTVLCSSKFIVLWQTTGVTHQDSSLSGFYHQFVAWSTQEIHPRAVLFLSAWSWALHENFVDCCCARESYLSHGERLSSLLTCQSLVCVSANYNYWVRLTIFQSKEWCSWGRSGPGVLVQGSCCQSGRAGNSPIEFYEISTKMSYNILLYYIL